jgi:UDP-N-acetylmuramoyl-L-alanyl-D-glutamate--2,6-diaminopimelate ligase
MLLALKHVLSRVLPHPVYRRLLSAYHFTIAAAGAHYYRRPARELFVIGVTGTKGKSTVTELIGRILRADGKRVATLSTIQFSIGDETERNLYKMTLPGRSFIQRFLRRAVDADCTHAVVELTSEGATQHRHRFVDLDAFLFTNLTPEHIESHGSFANYKQAKLTIRDELTRSRKRPRYLIVNADDAHSADFLDAPAERVLSYSLSDLTLHSLQKDSISLVFPETTLRVPLVGKFNVYNVLAAVTLCRALGVSFATIDRALHDLPGIPGRAERIESPAEAAKPVTVVVDYAHTPDSLEQLYAAFPDPEKVCVLGNTGGGRDRWKRPEMAAIAERHCAHVILTNEDPYDEDPRKIVADMEAGITDHGTVEVIMDRRAAIARAIEVAPENGLVLISGKGTDPYIMGPQGTKEEWSDAAVVRELLAAAPSDRDVH